jgi:hypothetical protein
MRPRLSLLVVVVFLTASFSSSVRAMDCPCTWEAVLCDADAIAEVEVILATKTSVDRMELRHVVWNGTKQRVRAPYGLTYVPNAIAPRYQLQTYLSGYRKNKIAGEPVPAFVERFTRAVRNGRYRTIAFLHYQPGVPWTGGGLVLNGVEWLDHPLHAEWWAKLQPYLAERIRLAAENKKPGYCADPDKESAFAKYNHAE